MKRDRSSCASGRRRDIAQSGARARLCSDLMAIQGTKRATRVTLRDVAERAGVSIATASYVLSGTDGEGARYSDETAQRVRDAAADLQYRLNRMARSVRTGRTGVIQLVLHMLDDPWTLSIAEAFSERTPAQGWTTLIAMDSDFGTALARSEFDAAFVVAVGATDNTEWRDELGPLARKVAVYSSVLDPDGFDVVRFDERGASQIAMRHLLERTSSVGCLTSIPESGQPEGSLRRQVYLESMREAGHEVPEGYVVEYERDLLDPYRAARVLLDRPDRPAAIFAEADFVAFAAVQTARELGLRVPEDVAVIGIGDSRQAEQADISSVGARDMREKIVAFVLERARDENTPVDRLLELEPTLFVRGSSR
ncbi:LacI family DNA-binding transcriptional regulator [Microbacterium sp. H1-D42]|uniref:LacI family DNA-binding transcriptional regulator n=1 Tax=Microbacterium sp. H1-D42 TaxID=2925844 RepID=UPI001F52CCC7|nr:LacI family DNA-binding transcriptional regulator [Microbacterium sp. H1-D42]UNK70484.1 LacI family transcriptional regulator [Microbacterium sp. H1-D42]